MSKVQATKTCLRLSPADLALASPWTSLSTAIIRPSKLSTSTNSKSVLNLRLI